MYEKILVGLDGSRLAEQILPYATEHARKCGSKLVFLQAYNLSANWTMAAGAQGIPAPSGDLIEQERESLHREAVKYLERQALPLREEGLAVACTALEGAAYPSRISSSRLE